MLLLASTIVVCALQAALYALFSVVAFVIAGIRRLASKLPAPAVWPLLCSAVALTVTLTLVVMLLFHVDQMLLAHFTLSVSASLYTVYHSLVVLPLAQVAALFVDPEPSSSAESVAASSSLLAHLLPSLSESAHLLVIDGVFLVAQAVLWDGQDAQQCAYQLSCSTLAVLSATLAVPHFLTASAFPSAAASGTLPLLSFPSSSALATLSALQLVLLFASTAPPVDSPLLQPVVFALYALTLLFISDASTMMLSLLFTYAVLLLCYIPHATHRCVISALEAMMAVDSARKRQDRTHVE